jgi:hypothetical protein
MGIEPINVWLKARCLTPIWYRLLESNQCFNVRSVVYYPLYESGIDWCVVWESNPVSRIKSPILRQQSLQHIGPVARN